MKRSLFTLISIFVLISCEDPLNKTSEKSEKDRFIDASIEVACMVFESEEALDPSVDWEAKTKEVFAKHDFDVENDEVMNEIAAKYQNDPEVTKALENAMKECAGYLFEGLEEFNVDQDLIDNKSTAYIYAPEVTKLYRSENGAYNVYGTVSDNCSRLVVDVTNETAGVYDSYELKNHKYGNTSFKYGIREDWNNLGIGDNYYIFTAYCDDGQVVSDFLNLNYSLNAGSSNTSNSSYDYSVPSYSYSGKTFHGYPCTKDCSGHEAGYEWAQDKGLYSYDDCSGNSNSFIEGCEAYLDDILDGRAVSVYDDVDEGDYVYGEDEYGNEVEVYVYEWDGSYGYGEDEYGNEVELYY